MEVVVLPELLSSIGAVELDGEAMVALTATFTVDGSVLAREVEFVMLVAFFIFLIYSSFNYCEISV
jgi:hypothetical protein